MLSTTRVPLVGGATVRAMQPTDAAACAALDKAHNSYNRATATRGLFITRMSMPNYINLIVEIQEEIVGFATIRIEVDGKEADWLNIVSDRRGQALGSTLIEWTKKELRSRGVEIVRGRCVKELIDYYRNLGCEITGVLPNFFMPGVHAYGLLYKL